MKKCISLKCENCFKSYDLMTFLTTSTIRQCTECGHENCKSCDSQNYSTKYGFCEICGGVMITPSIDDK